MPSDGDPRLRDELLPPGQSMQAVRQTTANTENSEWALREFGDDIDEAAGDQKPTGDINAKIEAANGSNGSNSSGGPPSPLNGSQDALRDEIGRRRSSFSRTFGEMQLNGVRHSMITLTSTALGGGVLSVSYVMRLAGVGLGPAMLAVGASLAFLGTCALMEMSTATGHETYAGLFSHCAGPRAGPTLDAMLFLFGFGSCVGYMVFLGDFIPSMLSLIDGLPDWARSREAAIIGSVLLDMPLVLQRDLNALRYVSPISIIALLYMAVIITQKSPALYKTHHVEKAEPVSVVDLTHFCEAFSLCIFAFNCHLNVVPVAGRLMRPTRTRIIKISSRVNLLQFTFYTLIGVTGYLSFLSDTPQDIIKGYEAGDVFVIGGRIMLTFTMLVAIPINVNPTVKCAMQIIDYFGCGEPLVVPSPLPSPRGSPPSSPQVPRREITAASAATPAPPSRKAETTRILLTLTCAGLEAGIAILVPGVADVLSLLGATVATAMMLVIPAYCMGVIMEPNWKNQAQRVVLYLFAVVSAASVPIKILRSAGIMSQ